MTARIPLVINAGAIQQVQSGDTLNATIQGVRIYAVSATDPSSPTPVNGDLYYNSAIDEWMYYDGSRAKWLSVATYTYSGGAKDDTAAGSYYRAIGELAYGTNIGDSVPKGTVTGLAWSRTDADAATMEVVIDTTSVSTLASSAAGKTASWTKNDDFSEGLLKFRNQAGGNTTSNVIAVVLVKRRI